MSRQPSKASRAFLLHLFLRQQAPDCSEPGPGASSDLTIVSLLLLLCWPGLGYPVTTFLETPLGSLIKKENFQAPPSSVGFLFSGVTEYSELLTRAPGGSQDQGQLGNVTLTHLTLGACEP